MIGQLECQGQGLLHTEQALIKKRITIDYAKYRIQNATFIEHASPHIVFTAIHVACSRLSVGGDERKKASARKKNRESTGERGGLEQATLQSTTAHNLLSPLTHGCVLHSNVSCVHQTHHSFTIKVG